MYYGAINNVCPDFRPLPPSTFKDQCDSFFYDGIIMNSNSKITIDFDHNKNGNYIVLAIYMWHKIII